MVNKSNHTLPALLLCLNDRIIRKTSPSDTQYWIRKLQSLKKEFHDMMGEDGVFFYPVHPEPAPKHKTTILKSHHTQVYSSIINALEVPVTQYPLGLTKSEGLPIGVQVVAGLKKDRLTLAFANEIQEVFGGWVPPSAVDIKE